MYYLILFLIFGLIAGSFLSVVISRIESDESFIWGRSKCPNCKEKIKAYDLVPFFSFLVLKGRCRKCKEKISIFYPVIEVLTGMLFAFLYLRFFGSMIESGLSGINIFMFFTTYIFAILVLLCVAFVDYFHYIIPDKIVFPAIVITFILSIINIIFGFNFFLYSPTFSNLFLGIFFGMVIFLILVLASKEKWMGWGDVKLGVFLGIILGFPYILIALFSSFILGSIVGIVLILFGKKKRKDAIQFGPFLVAGGLVTLFLGKYILEWYLG